MPLLLQGAALASVLVSAALPTGARSQLDPTTTPVAAAISVCDLNRHPRTHVGELVRVIAVHSALDYARVAFLSGGDCAPLDVVPTLPPSRTHGDTSVAAFFADAARACAGQRTCATLRLVEADVLVRRTPGTGAQVEFKHVLRVAPCASKRACRDALAAFSR